MFHRSVNKREDTAVISQSFGFCFAVWALGTRDSWRCICIWHSPRNRPFWEDKTNNKYGELRRTEFKSEFIDFASATQVSNMKWLCRLMGSWHRSGCALHLSNPSQSQSFRRLRQILVTLKLAARLHWWIFTNNLLRTAYTLLTSIKILVEPELGYSGEATLLQGKVSLQK